MSLSAGTKLGPYEILAPIGAGGMGEVYKALDSKLGREVAIKVLPDLFSKDKERLARFEREAKLLASLNHPNIATLFDLQESKSVHFLVLELVPGETLAERIKRGPVPLDEALPFFIQIAEALEAAHEKGIIHRDLKPANIKVTPEDKVKVLDFGLAKALVPEEPLDDSSQSPTLTKGTALGAIMGTAAYMSPEQARGKLVDKRTDVWAFGCCLYESLTGRKPFSGETVTDTLAAIVKNEPDWKALPSGTPFKVRELIRRCLQKDRNRRLHDVADARIEIVEAIDEPEVEWREEIRTKKRNTAFIQGMFVGALIAALLGAWIWSGLEKKSEVGAPPLPVTRSVIELPPKAPLALGGTVPNLGYDVLTIAVAPDGTELVYVGSSADGNRLYRRNMDSFEVEPISGTEGAITPFFSPDGRWVGFLTNDRVKKVSLQGGAPVTLCEISAPVRASWITDDIIYIAANEGVALYRVAASGGQPEEVANTLSILGHDARFGQVLPDGRSALVTSLASLGFSGDYTNILLLSLDSLETRTLIENGYDARYVSSGHILFARSGNLYAVPFDRERLEVQGEPAPIIFDVRMNSLLYIAQVTLPDTGLLAFAPGGDAAVGRPAWVERSGKTEFFSVPEGPYSALDLAQDGSRLAVHVADVNDYVWLYDIRRKEGRKLTTQGKAGFPVLDPEANRIAYSMEQETGSWSIYIQETDSARPPKALYSQRSTWVESWSRDGEWLAFSHYGNPVRIGFIELGTVGNPNWVDGNGSNMMLPEFSPDGKWVAYASDETGRYEIWIRSFPSGDVIRQISVDGGIEPLWCWGSGELFYRRGNQWFSTHISLQPELSWEPPRLAFETDFLDSAGRSYDVSPDGRRLLVVKRTREPIRTKIHIVHNWFDELERLVPPTDKN